MEKSPAENHLAHDIQDLLAQLVVLKTSKPNLGLLIKFKDSLYDATLAHMDDAASEDHKVLLSCWMYRFESIYKYSRMHVIPANEIDWATELIIKFDLGKELARNIDFPRIMARACLIRYAEKKPDDYNEEPRVGELVAYLTKGRIDPTQVTDLESAAAAVYGPACWALYRDDVGHDKKFAHHVWQLGVPPICFEKFETGTGIPQSLPNDFN